LIGGPLRAGRLRPTARLSTTRSNPRAMRMQTKCTPGQRASPSANSRTLQRSCAKHLKRVAAPTGAEQIRGDTYWLRAGHRDFLVDYKFVCLIAHHGKSTCFSIAGGPRHAKRGSGCVRITTPEEQSETV
jgi:hypothetical protein